MRVLVTGGSGVVGRGVVTELVARGHQVRLVSRHAEADAECWAEGVEPFAADVGRPGELAGAADGCDAVLHAAAIVDESPPRATFEGVNVAGTRLMLEEAARAGVRRFVYVSSLGAERGRSPYHASKRRAEALVRSFPGAWTVCRPGNVYGGGDGQITPLSEMARALPFVPVFGDGLHPFQPIFVRDLSVALRQVLEREDLADLELDLAGPDVTSLSDLLGRLGRLGGGRPAAPLPVPIAAVRLAARAAARAGLQAPVGESQLTMLVEGNVLAPGQPNALTEVLGITPTPLDAGLSAATEVQLPSGIFGQPVLKRFSARVRGVSLSPEALTARLVGELPSLLPRALAVRVEGEGLAEGRTLTMTLPGGSPARVRLEEVGERALTLVTLSGHPLAGTVRLSFSGGPGEVVFAIEVYAAPATPKSRLLLGAIGDRLQDRTWEKTVSRVVAWAGGRPAPVERTISRPSRGEAARAFRWTCALTLGARRRPAPFAASEPEKPAPHAPSCAP